jgi:hypothetical protein
VRDSLARDSLARDSLAKRLACENLLVCLFEWPAHEVYVITHGQFYYYAVYFKTHYISMISQLGLKNHSKYYDTFSLSSTIISLCIL